jgi:RNA polymerase sigma factor (sigma-70 family)
VTSGPRVEDLVRECAPAVLGALVRRYGRFDACEDAVQEALLAAARQWPGDGIPDRPRAWLLAVARRALIDAWRSDHARRDRETAAALEPRPQPPAGSADDTLTLLFLCCHPALPPASQLALTLRAVGGLTTAEVAAALLVPESAVARRITRAKARIRAAGARFAMPAGPEWAARLGVVRHVLYLIFNEGYATRAGPDLHRADLTTEAVRLTRLLHRQVPGDAETAGLLALMLLTDARRAARTDAGGRLVPLAEQDRSRWNADRVAEGTALLTRTLGRGPVGPYQLQAAIAALHDEARTDPETDWPQILALYDVLATVAPGPVVTLSRAVALARVHGPLAGLALVGTVDPGGAAGHAHRVEAVRAHLLEEAGEPAAARESYLAAARLTANLPEQRYLQLRAARLPGEG